MVKVLLLLFLVLHVKAATFENECLSCHQNVGQFNMYMKQYLLKYSSERRVKKAIFEYLKDPKQENSVLPFGYLRRFGIKEKSELNDEELRHMIDEFYKRYNFKDRIY